MQSEENLKKVVEKVANILADQSLTQQDLLYILTTILYSAGSSIEGYTPSSSSEVLIRYGEKPTLGNALMAQAIWMRDTWSAQSTQTKED